MCPQERADIIGLSGSSLVFTLEGAELTISTSSGGFSYTIESQHGTEIDMLASGSVPLDYKGKLLIRGILTLARVIGPIRIGKFSVYVVDDSSLGLGSPLDTHANEHASAIEFTEEMRKTFKP